MTRLGHPLELDVVVAGALVDGEADDDDVRALVAQWSQSIVVFLSRCVPQHQPHPLVVNLRSSQHKD